MSCLVGGLRPNESPFICVYIRLSISHEVLHVDVDNSGKGTIGVTTTRRGEAAASGHQATGDASSRQGYIFQKKKLNFNG